MAQNLGKRRWLSFSVRALLLFVLVSGLAFGWLGMRLRKARIQSEAVDTIERLGGEVRYEYQEDKRDNPSGPEWIRNLLGGHFFDRVARVSFTTPGIPNDRVTDISFLTEMDDLRMLYLDGTAVRDISLLADKRELWFLSLGHTQVEDLSPLAKLSTLKAISLSRTNVTDLSPLSGHKLERVWLRGTKVSDISVLEGMDGLVLVDLYKTPVSDISPLSTAHQLETLSLNWTQVADITPLKNMKNLKSLDINRTNVLEDLLGQTQPRTSHGHAAVPATSDVPSFYDGIGIFVRFHSLLPVLADRRFPERA